MASVREIMWEAWSAEVGVEVAVSDIELFKRRFYAERAKAREEGVLEFDSLQLISPPPDVHGKLWIVKNGQAHRKNEGEAGAEAH